MNRVALVIICVGLSGGVEISRGQNSLVEEGVRANGALLEALTARIQNLESQFVHWDTIAKAKASDGISEQLVHRLGGKVYVPWYQDTPEPEGAAGPAFFFSDNSKVFAASDFEVVSAVYRPIIDNAGDWWLDFSVNIKVTAEGGLSFVGGNLRMHHPGGDADMPWLEEPQLIDGFIWDQEGTIVRPTKWSFTRPHPTNRAFALQFPSTVVASRILLRGFIKLRAKPNWVAIDETAVFD